MNIILGETNERILENNNYTKEILTQKLKELRKIPEEDDIDDDDKTIIDSFFGDSDKQ